MNILYNIKLVVCGTIGIIMLGIGLPFALFGQWIASKGHDLLTMEEDDV